MQKILLKKIIVMPNITITAVHVTMVILKMYKCIQTILSDLINDKMYIDVDTEMIPTKGL